jgi:hypothetical protein
VLFHSVLPRGNLARLLLEFCELRTAARRSRGSREDVGRVDHTPAGAGGPTRISEVMASACGFGCVDFQLRLLYFPFLSSRPESTRSVPCTIYV